MPVILHPGNYELWLDEDALKLGLLRDLLRTFPSSDVVGYRVSPLVNSPKSQGAELVKQLEM
jgi:putative SOS response-associated peptidase YedK